MRNVTCWGVTVERGRGLRLRVVTCGVGRACEGSMEARGSEEAGRREHGGEDSGCCFQLESAVLVKVRVLC